MQMKKRRWTQYEIDFLKRNYATRTCVDIAEWVHHTPRGVEAKALSLGLRKPEGYKEEHCKGSRFQKGHVPFNKGKKQAEWINEEGARKIAAHQFKKGQVRLSSHTYRPVGYEHTHTSNGRKYVYIKIAADRKMVLKHRWLWEQANGPIPKGCNVQFKDGNTLNCVLENLYLISRAKQLRKNFDDLPEDRKAETRKKAIETRNKRIRRDQVLLRWGLEPKGRLVKRVR